MSNKAEVKKAGVAAPASVQSANQTSKVRSNTMNNSTVAIRQAFDKGDIAALVGVHHTQIKAALPSQHQRELLFTAWARSEFEPPKWLEIYEKHQTRELVKREERAQVSLGRRVIESTVDAREYVDLLLRKKSMLEWAAEINARQAVITKSGREISAAASTLWRAQFAMTKMAMAIKAAVDLKGMNPVEATRLANRVHDELESLMTRYAALRRHGHQELVVADVRLTTHHGDFDSPASDAQTKEDWERMLQDEGLGWDDIAELDRDRELEHMSHQNELLNRKDAMAEDEGSIQTALHDFGQLLEIDATDIAYSEGSYAQVTFMDMNWPTDHPMWDDLVARLEDAWAATIGWTDTPEEEAEATKKAEKRATVVEDFHAKPYQTRWTLNHVTRRVWRDIQMLKRRRNEYADRVDKAVHEAYLNERFRVPSGLNRHRDESPDNGRVANLLYREVHEADVQYNSLAESNTQLDTDLHYWGAVIEQADELLDGLTSLYQKLRAMEDESAILWEMFANDGMPAQPPIYWNNRTFYLTEEEAVAALKVEIQEQGELMRAKDGDALTQVAAMLNDGFGLDI